VDCLALITRTSTSHLLQIYDVDRGNGRYPISQTSLSHSQRADVEVTHVEFSPDDIFLALGRNDHLIEIYDLRFMKTPVQTYKQDLENRCLDKSREWGITGLHWTTDTSRGLLSAGSDGEFLSVYGVTWTKLDYGRLCAIMGCGTFIKLSC